SRRSVGSRTGPWCGNGRPDGGTDFPALPVHGHRRAIALTAESLWASVQTFKDTMVIGYLRVSTGKQNLANQQDEIRRFAESRNFTVNSWVTEVVSGSKNERDRKLGALLKRMKPGDTLIVTEISRLSR